MPGDFKSVRDELVALVLNSHPATSSSISAAMVRQLTALEPERVPFMEKEGSFSTVAGQAAYGGPDGLLAGLHSFERLYYDLGASMLPIDRVDEYTVRYFQEQPAQAYPTRACWLGGKLQFGPAPAAAYVVKWDGFLSSRLDAATGKEITAEDTVENHSRTNPWFAEGVVTYKHLVLADYYSNDPASGRADLAQTNGGFATSQLSQLRKAQQQKKDMGTVAVVPNAFDRYAVWGSRRIQTLFPGAHGD